jgi:hypothetical protein
VVPSIAALDRAKLAIKAGEHTDRALATIVELLGCRRDSVRFQAACKLLELAVGAQGDGEPRGPAISITINQSPEDGPVSERLRRRATVVEATQEE